MLRNTFCHIPGIGPKSEHDLWNRGIRSWDDVAQARSLESVPSRYYLLRSRVRESIQSLKEGDCRYFAEALPTSQHWRLFGDFRDSAVYLDIETSGLAGGGSCITTIATFDGKSVMWYVKGRNLEQFKQDIQKYKLVVTYNGSCFDVPFIESYLKIRMRQPQIDLRFLLKSLGYTGGLKGCEKKLGLDRDELDGVDGYCAVLLWNDFATRGNKKALETLLAYNVLDAVNLETLMVTAYNLKLRETPFYETHQLPLPGPVRNPFEPDRETVDRILEVRYAYS
ncbi:MAG: ribonuclease H-like domain-containing protein [Desulfomonile tiedjei]|nr:ribonuclease H-like domain-containing protein [Desulfomonile tiedjei]